MVKSEVINTKSPLKILEINSCSIPYYRCFTKCCHDSVLVKDIGVTCELLKVTKPKKNRRKSSLIIDYNVKQTKSDNSNEISSITRRINSYTRDILNNFTMKINKRQYSNHEKLNIVKIPIATEYLDQNGQSTLKLRLHDSDNNSSQCNINNYSSMYESEKFSKSKLQIIYPPVKINSDELTNSGFTHSMNSYLTSEKGKSSRLNPLLSIEDIDVDDIIRELFGNIPKYAVDSSTINEIKLHTVIEGGTFKFAINLNRADSEEFGKEVMIPLATYVVELQEKFNNLIDEIKRKDEEIIEYEACGAKLIRTHIKTKRFNANSWLPNALQEYKEMLSMCQLIARDNKKIKLEKNIKVESNIGEKDQEKITTKSQLTESEFNSADSKKRKTLGS
ncbi:hypothetical protein PV325_006973 [Microctonus aethiopoides]|nr:hypothetical protein PV325_006973 [Microctonus aethiopoides]